MPDFRNTELAFRHQNDKDLLRTRRLFRWMNSPLLSRIGPPIVNASLKLHLPVEGIVRNTLFDIFCGGSSLENAQTKIAQLYSGGVRTILDYSVEGEKSQSGFDRCRDEIMRTIDFGAKHEAVEFSALKVSGLCDPELMTRKQAGEKLSGAEEKNLEAGFARLDSICAIAFEKNQSVFIDAEETWFQNVVDAWAENLMEKYNRSRPIVYTTTQMYRHDRLNYLQALVERARTKGYFVGVKIVRGAYLEKENERAQKMGYPTPMQPDKASTDRDFNASLKFCIDNIDRVALCAGTHNEESAAYLAKLISEKGIDPGNRFVVFAQLLGMSDHISFNLSHAGFNAAKYVPYGPVRSVIPYLIRRAEENSSVAGQSSRELELLETEAKRRGI